MNKQNFQKELDKILAGMEKSAKPKTLFLHSCCAPCSSYVLEYLSPHFEITVFYYNPNITASAEYFKRVQEQKRLIALLNETAGHYPIKVVEGDYKPEVFLEMAKGLESCPEGGERCFGCYRLRLEETAKRAAECGADYFATTLTISPLKNAEKLNDIGEELAALYNVPWLPSDFKKKNGYKRSIQLSAEYDLYRQDYCGCAFSKAERERQKQEAQTGQA